MMYQHQYDESSKKHPHRHTHTHAHSLESCATCQKKSHSKYIKSYILYFFLTEIKLGIQKLWFRIAVFFFFLGNNFFSNLSLVGVDEMKTHHVCFASKMYGHVFHISVICHRPNVMANIRRIIIFARALLHIHLTYAINLIHRVYEFRFKF